MPDVYTEELEKLVDQVAPVPFAEIQRILAEELPTDLFVRIDPEPIATASIAQVHAALLQSGREVIVKVRRPGIEEKIGLDLALMRSTAALLERRSERAQLLQAQALADELETHLRAELDFVEEANNTEVIAGLLTEYEDLVVPGGHPPVRHGEGARAGADRRAQGRRRSRLRAGSRTRARPLVLPRVRLPGDRSRRVPRRPAPGKRPAHHRRPPGARGFRAPRPAGRRHAAQPRAASARHRAEPRRRRRRPDPGALPHDARFRRRSATS